MQDKPKQNNKQVTIVTVRNTHTGQTHKISADVWKHLKKIPHLKRVKE